MTRDAVATRRDRSSIRSTTLKRAPDLARGSQLVSRLPEVFPEEASPRIGRVYDDIQETLRVPVVNFLFRILANYPDFLVGTWEESREQFRTLAFEQAADRVRAEALLDQVPPFDEVVWHRLGDPQQILALTETAHYVLPKLLLVATAFDERLAGRRLAGFTDGGTQLWVDTGFRAGVASEAVGMSMVEAGDGSPLDEIFQDIEESHRHPGVASYYRALGGWPDFLAMTWACLKPLVGSIAYEDRREQLVAHALGEVRTAPRNRHEPYHSGESADLCAILAAFRFRLIPDLLMDVATVMAMLDSPEAARQSRLSLATTVPATGSSLPGSRPADFLRRLSWR